MKLEEMSYFDKDFEEVMRAEYKAFTRDCQPTDVYTRLSTIQSFIYYLGWQEWMKEYVCSQGYEEFDETSDVQYALIDKYIREVLS